MASPVSVKDLDIGELVQAVTAFFPAYDTFDDDVDTYSPSDDTRSLTEVRDFGLRLMSYLTEELGRIKGYALHFSDPQLGSGKVVGSEDPEGLFPSTLIKDAIKRLVGAAKETPGQDSLSEIVRLEEGRHIGVSLHELCQADAPNQSLGFMVYLREGPSEQGASFSPGEIFAIEKYHRRLDSVLRRELQTLEKLGKLTKATPSHAAPTVVSGGSAAASLHAVRFTYGRDTALQTNAGALCEGKQLYARLHGTTFPLDALGVSELVKYWTTNFKQFGEGVARLPDDLGAVLVREPGQTAKIQVRSPQMKDASVCALYQGLLNLRRMEYAGDTSQRHLLEEIGWALPLALKPDSYEALRRDFSVKNLTSRAAQTLTEGNEGITPISRDHPLIQILNLMNDTGRHTMTVAPELAAAADFAETLILLGTLEHLFNNRGVTNRHQAVTTLLDRLGNPQEYGTETHLLTATPVGPNSTPFFEGLRGYDAIRHIMSPLEAVRKRKVDVFTKYSIR